MTSSRTGGSAPGEGRYGEALFTPDGPREAERIDAAALVYDPVTTHRLRALGAGPGSRCLEVGAGTGTVARWLLEEAGVDEVVALDRDTGSLDALATPRLRVVTADLTDETLRPGRFDLIHARFVLMHLPQRRRIITRLARWLSPGGRLVLADALEVPVALDSTAAYRRTMDAMWRALRSTIGTDISSVPAYPHFLREEGLLDVAAELYSPPLVAGGPLALFWAETWNRMRPALEETGLVDAAVVDEAVAYLSSPRLAELGPGMVMAWGRRG
ncbi:methyltransferase domain-containing protein [Streptomyces sp. SID486]|uniref:class I SAM-dependent methyltransferase n=1 Tax=unclassified Streptomyces TaxID=2593676 RepID=UPI00136ACFD1|nr:MULTISPECIES: class I SAM-dependent methyltransferase [unclassified Streptomyces]MYW48572.1 methyltransferase domain-containing protein [Streptomyces sp. SID161]MYX95562.1 methyltransferase domain-containing protein [Streptomyces sp. SID486]